MPRPYASETARARRRSRGAFTLIELMVSVALSLVVMLVALSGFRIASQAIAAMNRLSEENSLLRTGYFLVSEDADFWHSHANPDYPYLKGHMSDEVEIANDRGNNLFNKRIFKPVTFDPRTHSDPNWLQPNDRRSWYRNYVMQGPCPWSFDKTNPDYQPKQVYGEDPAHLTYRSTNSTIPVGWEPWHIYGDYSPLSNLATDSDGDPADLVTGERPYLIWKLFKELGHAGVYTYMPPGTLNLILRPNTNLTVGNIGDADRNFDKGEIPWSLSVPIVKSVSGSAPLLNYVYEKGTMTVPTEGAFPDNLRGHYFYGMPGRCGILSDSGSALSGGLWNGRDWWDPRPAQARDGTSDAHWLADLEQINGDSDQAVALLIGTRYVATDIRATAFDDMPLIANTLRDPWRSLGRPYFLNAEGGGNPETMSFWQQKRDYSSQTVYMPSNITDSITPDLDDKPADSPSLSTNILRFRIKGADRTVCHVRIQDPTTGLVHELGFTVLTTTLRGARQHWGWKSHFDIPGLKDIGDEYKK